GRARPQSNAWPCRRAAWNAGVSPALLALLKGGWAPDNPPPKSSGPPSTGLGDICHRRNRPAAGRQPDRDRPYRARQHEGEGRDQLGQRNRAPPAPSARIDEPDVLQPPRRHGALWLRISLR